MKRGKGPSEGALEAYGRHEKFRIATTLKYRLDKLIREGMPDTSCVVATPVGDNCEDDTTWAEYRHDRRSR